MDDSALPACHRDARELLTRHQLGIRQILTVDVDSILYVDLAGKPWTAWLHRRTAEQGYIGDSLEIRNEEGFPAERGVLFSGEEPPHDL